MINTTKCYPQIDIVKFHSEHIKALKFTDIDTRLFMPYIDFEKLGEIYSKGGPAITIMANNYPIGAGGIISMWKGVGEAWLMLTPEAREKHTLSVYANMKQFLETAIVQYEFHRIQACILWGHDKAVRCAVKLGFMPESPMLFYGPNKEHFVRYVILRG